MKKGPISGEGKRAKSRRRQSAVNLLRQTWGKVATALRQIQIVDEKNAEKACDALTRLREPKPSSKSGTI